MEKVQEVAEEEEKSRALSLQAHKDVESYRAKERRRRRDSVVGRNLEAKRWAEVDREAAKEEAEMASDAVKERSEYYAARKNFNEQVRPRSTPHNLQPTSHNSQPTIHPILARGEPEP